MDPKTHSFQVHLAFKVLMILSSAIHINYHILLRSSSYWEPRYPLLKLYFLFFGLIFSKIMLLIIKYISRKK